MKTLKRNKLNNKQGMTLIELVVALALTTILITAMAAVFYPVIKVFNSQQTQANLKDIANQTIVVLKEEVRDAQKIKLSDSPISDMVCYYTMDGEIKTEDPLHEGLDNLLISGRYQDYGVRLSFNKKDSINNALDIIFTFYDVKTDEDKHIYNGSASSLNPNVNIDVSGNQYLCIKK